MDGLGEMSFNNFYKDKVVFVTGHTGFKGSWLSLWLQKLGAKVIGFSLNPPTTPSLFEEAKIKENIVSIISDVRDYKSIHKSLKKYKPSIIFHLAAQSLVIESYKNPIDTLSTNVMGTVNILEACRELNIPTLVNVTSDKCYNNIDSKTNFKETDALGGNDVYSASKACSEIITHSYVSSFFKDKVHNITKVATARAGNVIGGGDWADNRLIPDISRALSKDKTIEIRSPHSTRPWQHVFDPLNGYLSLARNLHLGVQNSIGAWNFGPSDRESRSVEFIAKEFCELWGHSAKFKIKDVEYSESLYLNLDSSKSMRYLNWKPKLSITQSLNYTAKWYKAYYSNPDTIREFSLNQIDSYEKIDE